MAKVNERALYAGIASLAIAGVALRAAGPRSLRRFATALLCFAGLEALLVLLGGKVAGSIWWLLHAPSALLLGVDEILERYGPVVSTLAHLGDLVLWSVISASVGLIGSRKSAVAA